MTQPEDQIVIINLLQKFYKTYNKIPSTRALINYCKQNDVNMDSITFIKLFPGGIAQARQMAQLPDSTCL